MSYGVEDFRLAADKRKREIRDELRQIAELRRQHEANRQALNGQRQQTLEQLAGVILPSLEPEAIKRAVHLTGFVALKQQDPQAAIAVERTSLEQRVAEIEKDSRWIDRVRLRAPRTGDLVRHVAELEDLRAPLRDVIARCETHERFHRLVDNGYGTDAYGVHWWRLSYYSDWKAGDEIVALFPDKKTFAEVRAEYDTAAQTMQVYDQKLKELGEEIAAGEALEHGHDDALERLQRLPEIYLRDWQERLRGHVGALDVADILDRLSGEPDVELLFKQSAGLTKKLDYLDEVIRQQVVPHERALTEEQVALDRDLQKFLRPKNRGARFDGQKFERRFEERPAKLQKSWQRTYATYGTVSAFDSWQRARLVDDFLWWDLMTDGRYDGRYIPEVSTFRDQHPDYRWDRDAFAEQVAIENAVLTHVEAEQDPTTHHHDVS